MTDFSELGLSAATLKAVADTGYTTATPIQAEAIPMALQGLDVLGIAQTGTGKTAAFTLPMIDRLAAGRSKARMPRSLVICPTRELADQVSQAFEKYAKGQKLSWALLIGGVSFGDQEAKLDRGVDVLVATPGRLLDHFERGKLLLTGVQILVVDEADRMLDMGFIPDIERIFKMTPPKKQTLFFSATMPPEITRLTKQFLNNPVRIEASRPAMTADTITQNTVRIPTSDPKAKRTALRMLVERGDVKNGIVFCNRKAEVDVVAKSLKTHGFDAAPIHGDLDQSTRMRTLENFRKGELRLLVASDVAARGLDIPDVSHVFNYDVPHHADDYVHRIGRTGRAGKLGQTFMIVTPGDAKQFDKVVKLTGKMPEEVTLDVDWSSIKDDGGGERGRSSPRGRTDRNARGGERSERSERGERGRRSERGEPRAEAVAEAAVEAQAAPTAAATEEAPPRRSRSRSRGGRSERGERPPEHVSEPATEAVAQPEAAAPAAERPRREPRPDRAREVEAQPAQPAHAHRDRPRRDERSPRREDRDDHDGVVGFGNDLPAFLARPAPRIVADD